MKKIYITILMFLAIFFNIDNVNAKTYSTTYNGFCSLQEDEADENSGYCQYLCGAWGDEEVKKYYYKFAYKVSYTSGKLTHSIYDYATDGSCKIFGDPEKCKKISDSYDIYTGQNTFKKHPADSDFIVNNVFTCRNVEFDVTVKTTERGDSEGGTMIDLENIITIYLDSHSLGEELNNKYNTNDNVCGSFGGKDSKTVIFLNKIYKYVKILIPIVIIILSIIDFIKVLVSGKEDDTKKSISKFVKRIIVAIIFILVPTLISLFINVSGLSEQYEGLNDGVKALLCILG